MEKIFYEDDGEITANQFKRQQKQIGLKNMTSRMTQGQLKHNIMSKRRKKDEMSEMDIDEVKNMIVKDIGVISSASILTNAKKKIIIKQFIQKLKRTIVRRIPQNEETFFQIDKNSDYHADCFMNDAQNVFKNMFFNNIFMVIKFIVALSIFLLTSISSTFFDPNHTPTVDTVLKCVALAVLLIELLSKVIHLNIYYYSNQMKIIELVKVNFKTISLISILLLTLIFYNNDALINNVACIMFLYEAVSISLKIERVQNLIALNSHLQQYWNLLKILLVNFFIAHCLSIILNSMTNFNVEGEENWYAIKKLDGRPWYEKYVWGYYWGTTIMLTVGFGDISANNWQEALCLIFIETFSCIILAYNISEVSKVIQKMRELTLEKNQKLKILHSMSRNNSISQQLHESVKNYIQKSTQVKKGFQVQEEEIFLKDLPQKMELDFRKESHKNIFAKAGFLRDLTFKCQQKLAEKINKIVCHPQEIILRKGQLWKILILKSGSVGLSYRRDKSTLNGTVIDQIKNSLDQTPTLISMNFVWKDKTLSDVKSLDYSVLAHLDLQVLQQILKNYNDGMFEFYCFQRDKKRRKDELVHNMKCKICKQQNHSKIHCPLMHYCPLAQHIIYKYLWELKKKGLRGSKQNRQSSFYRTKSHFRSCTLKDFAQTQELFLEKMFSNNHVPGFQNLSRRKSRASRQSTYIAHVAAQATVNFNELSKKIDKCQLALDETLHWLKGNTIQTEIQVDKPWNYKYYFAKSNPQNLINIYSTNTNKKINTKKGN